ncbi:MAG: hypothetical protein AAFP03_03965 [Cyanobacteria bacterium J06598_3]
MRTLRLMADYGSYPVWEIFVDGSDNLATENLPVSDALKHDLEVWEQKYASTFDEDYPPDGGFLSKAEEEAFEQEGRRLWERLRQALDSEIALEPYRTHSAGVAKKALV